jgi:hypothetical protein
MKSDMQYALRGVSSLPSGQDGSNQGLVGGGDREDRITVGSNLRILGVEPGEFDVGILCASVLLDEEVHVQDTTHPTGIITKEDTTESCESNNQVSAKSDGSFDTTDVGRARNGDDTTTRHLECSTTVSLLGKTVTRKVMLFGQEEESRTATKEE